MINAILDAAATIVAAFLIGYSIVHICFWSRIYSGVAQALVVIAWFLLLFVHLGITTNPLLYSAVAFAGVSISHAWYEQMYNKQSK